MDQHLAHLRAYWKRHKSFPPMSALTEVLGLASKGGVFKVMGKLVEAGYLARTEGRRFAPTRKFFAYPVLGDVRAGLPQPVQQEAQPELLSVEDLLLDHPSRTSYCRVRGDSMSGVGLLDGDFVVTVANLPTAPGDIVVAAVDGEVTVKYLRRDDQGWFLEPANPAYPVIRPDGSLEVLGVVTGMFRKYRR
ncbi:LexA family protein [Azohydromonas sediminis]|uniref:LexA family protein n=1 Tax=Azohydromonas sediminis TaxID=2259674 RepID=UPI000E65E747|nr:S24 family peptidase [Azohydromonas sediminis]